MDQIPQFYENLSGDSILRPDQHAMGLSQQDAYTVMQQLSMSIDLHKLASVYHAQLKARLRLKAVTIEFSAGSLTLGDSTESGNIKKMEMSSHHTRFATLRYAFESVLSLREANILQELHRCFMAPLKNALEHHAVKQLALKDHLTSLGNRANYHETLARLISNANRTQEGFALLVIDMDRFKQINDTFGHYEGDSVLMAMADVMRHSLRDTDYAFRFGGDEFCCLLPSSDASTNDLIALRIQHYMAQNPVLARHGITCSIGCTCYLKGDSEKSLFARADKALYLAKQSGRSCFKAA